MTCCVNRLLSWILFGTSFIVRYVQRNHNTYQGRAEAGEEGDYDGIPIAVTTRMAPA